MGLNAQEIESAATRLTDRAEHGQDVTRVLEQMSPQDRLAVAKMMDKQNEEHRKTNSNLPDLDIKTDTNPLTGEERLKHMDSVRRGYVWDSRDQAYDRPAGSTILAEQNTSQIEQSQNSRREQNLPPIDLEA